MITKVASNSLSRQATVLLFFVSRVNHSQQISLGLILREVSLALNLHARKICNIHSTGTILELTFSKKPGFNTPFAVLEGFFCANEVYFSINESIFTLMKQLLIQMNGYFL